MICEVIAHTIAWIEISRGDAHGRHAHEAFQNKSWLPGRTDSFCTPCSYMSLLSSVIGVSLLAQYVDYLRIQHMEVNTAPSWQ